MYARLKNDILGKKYSLSIAFITARESREINRKYRRKNKPANILSFPYSASEGEILLCKSVIIKGARKLKKTYRDYLTYLVIHGMLHLKGMRHGSKMESKEQQYAKKHLYRNRLRLA